MPLSDEMFKIHLLFFRLVTAFLVTCENANVLETHKFNYIATPYHRGGAYRLEIQEALIISNR